MLAERVARGELPPVEERLPENPLVVEPVKEIGKYGGTWRRLTLGPRDILLASRMGYDPLVRWDRSAKNPAPNLAERWEILDGGRTYVFHLRKGLKWSDGHPLTSEDFRFVYEDWLCNKELSPVFPSWLKIGGEPARLEAPDPTTVIFRFAEPYGIFLEMLAYQSMMLLAPKHYLMQFHARYTDKTELEAMARERGFDLWYQLFADRANIECNPDVPTWKAWKLTVPPPASRVICERNPYYWKADPAGNQLPYIDRLAISDVQNNEIVTIKAMAGDVSFQARRVDASNYSLFMQNRDKGHYRVMRDLGAASIVLYVNNCSKDPELRPILQDRRFRIALSVAVNRKEICSLLYRGLARPSRAIASPYDPFYLPEFDEKHIQYDPALANSLLDEVGMPRGRNGLRRMPGGKPFKQILHVFPSEAGTSNDLWQLVADYFREVGLDFAIKQDAVSLSGLAVRAGNSDFWAYSVAGVHWILEPLWYVPWQSSSYFAPAYGRYQASGGKDKLGVKPSPEFQRLIDWYLELRSVVNDEDRKLALGRNILRQWSEQCYTIGIARQELLTIVADSFKNVPDHIIHDYRIMTPGYIGAEQFYIDNE